MKDISVKEQDINGPNKILDFLSSGNRIDLASRLKKEEIPRKTVIHYQEDRECRFYEIIQGQVKISKFTEDGREITVEILKEGDYFGFVPLVDGGNCECTATALTDCICHSLGKTDFDRILEQDPRIIKFIFNIACQRLRKVYTHLENITTGSIHKRVSRILLELGRQEGKYEDDILVFKIRLTHQELANLAGTTRETVTRVLTYLKKRSIIEIKRSMVHILDEEEMENVC